MRDLAFVLGIALLLPFTQCQQDPVVDTPYGSVRGKSIPTEDGSVIDAYMAVPFAKPPIGDLRFELPEPVDPWDDVLDGSVPGAPCTQYGYFQYSEDCLHANIYTPQREDPDELLPVMVWIHGGDYYAGANFEYPGYFLARKGVVVVTINYRLGILGFAYTADGVISGNMGLMDQVQGLTFVQEVIASFGGDPNQVTIFGESAGGTSVGQLLMIPFAEGLFHGAIMQSGCEMEIWATMYPEMEPEKFVEEIAQQFGCPTTTTEIMVTCLRQQDAYQLSQATYTCPPGYESECAGFRAVIDGTIIPDRYYNLRQSGQYIKVPEIQGMNENDGYFALYSFPNIENGLSREDFNSYLIDRANYLAPKYPDSMDPRDLAESFHFFYADWPYYEDVESNRDMVGRMYTDEWYGWPADFQAKLHSDDGNQVYYYVYDYLPDLYKPDTPEWIGVNHGIELDCVFGWPYLVLPGNEAAYEHSQTTWWGNYSNNDLQYSDFMMTLWTNFAKFGDPTPTPIVGPNTTLVNWQAFSSSELNVLDMESTPRSVVNYRQKEYAFWREYLRYIIYGETFEGDKASLTGNGKTMTSPVQRTAAGFGAYRKVVSEAIKHKKKYWNY